MAATATTGLVGWSGYSIWMRWDQFAGGGSLVEWPNWVFQWSMPSLLCLGVLGMTMRKRHRNESNFAEAGQSLLAESLLLEERLDAINGKIQLARDQLVTQSHELEALGQVTTSRLFEGARQFEQIVSDNLEKVEAIATSSKESASNMEKLRAQLPGIVVTAKEVTNNLANAGRTAHLQLEDMVSGFHRLNEFGLASGHQVHAIRAAVAAAADELGNQLEELGEITERRFAALVKESETHRQRLEQDEVAAITALRNRASAIAEEVASVRAASEMAETTGLDELRQRLTILREDSAHISAQLSEYEAKALSAWTARSAEMEAQIAQHKEAAETVMQESAEAMARRLAELEQVVAAHQEQQLQRVREVATHCAAIEQQVTSFSSLIQKAAADGGYAGRVMETAMTQLEARLSAGHATLSQTQAQIADLSEAGARLLELIETSSQYTSTAIPNALGSVATDLSQIEQRVETLRGSLDQAGHTGRAVFDNILLSRIEMASVTDDLTSFHKQADEGASTQAYRLLLLREQIENARSECVSLVETMETSIDSAITRLTQVARKAEQDINAPDRARVSGEAGRASGPSSSGQSVNQRHNRPTFLLASGLELLEEEQDPVVRQRYFELLKQSATEAGSNTAFLRLAPRAAGEMVPVEELRVLISALVGDSIAVNWGLMGDALPRSAVKVLLSLVELGVDALAARGSLDIASEFHDGVSEIVVRASGQHVAFDPGIGAALAGTLPLSELSSHTAPAALLHRMVAASGGGMQHHVSAGTVVLGAMMPMAHQYERI